MRLGKTAWAEIEELRKSHQDLTSREFTELVEEELGYKISFRSITKHFKDTKYFFANFKRESSQRKFTKKVHKESSQDTENTQNNNLEKKKQKVHRKKTKIYNLGGKIADLYQQGKTVKEISTILDIPEDTVGNHLYKNVKTGFGKPISKYIKEKEEKKLEKLIEEILVEKIENSKKESADLKKIREMKIYELGERISKRIRSKKHLDMEEIKEDSILTNQVKDITNSKDALIEYIKTTLTLINKGTQINITNNQNIAVLQQEYYQMLNELEEKAKDYEIED